MPHTHTHHIVHNNRANVTQSYDSTVQRVTITAIGGDSLATSAPVDVRGAMNAGSSSGHGSGNGNNLLAPSVFAPKSGLLQSPGAAAARRKKKGAKGGAGVGGRDLHMPYVARCWWMFPGSLAYCFAHTVRTWVIAAWVRAQPTTVPCLAAGSPKAGVGSVQLAAVLPAPRQGKPADRG